MPLDSSTKKRWLWVLLFVGIWTFLALLSAVESYVSQLLWDKPILWTLALRRNFKDWYSYGLLSIGILWFCQKNPWRPGRTISWVLRHFAAALVFSVAWMCLSSWLVAGERSVQTGQTLTFLFLIRKLAVHYAFLNLIMYWMVVLAHLGWHNYQRFRERDLQAADLKRELVEARLNALRMQLHPHFLFNTLHAVSALIHENPEAADRVVARLSELLRLSLDQTKPQEVPLSEELAFLDRYLEIEQTRFSDRLTVQTQIEPGAERALVPYLILQPLVENAIRHGIELREANGRVTISATRKNGTLELRIADNGPGFTGEGRAPVREGIGLSNTRSRLRHLYPDQYRLELAEVPGGGLEACIDIPFREQQKPG
jgi:sensor histidine kinase YesM